MLFYRAAGSAIEVARMLHGRMDLDRRPWPLAREAPDRQKMPRPLMANATPE